MFRKSSTWILTVIFLGFIVRLLWLVYAEPVPVSDFAEYRQMAEVILQKGQIGVSRPSAFRPPGYPVFLTLIMAINHSLTWLSFVNVVLSTCLIYLVYAYALNLTSKKWLSIIAASFCAFNPTFIFFSPILASEHLYVVFLFSAFLLLGNNHKKLSPIPFWRLVFGGIVFGLAVLTRGDGLFFFPVFLIMAYFAFKNTNRSIFAVLIASLTFILTISPWIIRNHFVVGPGSGLSTTGGINFYFGHNDLQYGWHSLSGTVLESSNELENHKLGYEKGFDYIKQASFQDLAKDVAKGTEILFLSQPTYSIFWNNQLPIQGSTAHFFAKNFRGIPMKFQQMTKAYFALFMLAFFSLIFIPRYSLRTWVGLYGIVFMNWIGYAIIFWSKPRYRFVSEIVFCILAALFLYEVAKYLGAKISRTTKPLEG